MLHHKGSITGVFEFLLLNGLSITDDLEIGKDYAVDESVLFDQDILGYYNNNSIIPATAIGDDPNFEILEGIDYWAIGSDFIIS